MQVIGYLLLGLLAVLLAVLLLPHRAELKGEGTEVFSLRLWLWCILPLTLAKKPERKKKRAPKPKKAKAKTTKKAAKPKPEKPAKRKLTPWELLELVDSLLPQAGKATFNILRRLTVTRCRVQVVVSGGDDPAATAEKAGKTEAALYSLYTPLASLMKFREFSPAVYPCFTSEEAFTEVGRYQLAIRAIPAMLISPALGLVFKIMLPSKPAKNKTKPTKTR